jgi:hypothetical protein
MLLPDREDEVPPSFPLWEDCCSSYQEGMQKFWSWGLQKEIDALQAQNEKLWQENTSWSDQFETFVSNASREKSELEGKLGDAEAEKKRHHHTIGELQKEVERLVSNESNLTTARDELQSDLDQLLIDKQKVEQDNQTLKGELDNQTQQKDSLEAGKLILEQQIEGLRGEITSRNDTITEFTRQRQALSAGSERDKAFIDQLKTRESELEVEVDTLLETIRDHLATATAREHQSRLDTQNQVSGHITPLSVAVTKVQKTYETQVTVMRQLLEWQRTLEQKQRKKINGVIQAQGAADTECLQIALDAANTRKRKRGVEHGIGTVPAQAPATAGAEASSSSDGCPPVEKVRFELPRASRMPAGLTAPLLDLSPADPSLAPDPRIPSGPRNQSVLQASQRSRQDTRSDPNSSTPRNWHKKRVPDCYRPHSGER